MPYALLLLINLIYAATPTMMKLAVAGISPTELVWLRHSLALLAILPFALWLPRVRLTLREAATIVTATLLAFTLTSLMQVHAVQQSGASMGALMVAMEPIATISLAALFLHERISLRLIISVALGIIGLMILSGVGERQMEGSLLYLLAVICEASLGIFLRPLLARHHPSQITFYCLLVASLALLPFQGNVLTHLQAAPALSLWAVAYLGIACSGLGTLFWLVSLKKVAVSQSAVMWFVQPVGGSALAVAILGEPVSMSMIVAGVIILAGLGVVIHHPRRRHTLVQPTVAVNHPHIL